MTTRAIKTLKELDGWIRFLHTRASEKLPMTVSCIKGASRTKAQNSLIHKWFSQIGNEIGEEMMEVKARCKRAYGLPILERDNPEWVEEWKPVFHAISDYEIKMKLWEVVPVTSIMTSKQLSEFMDAMQREYSSQGIKLIDPGDMKYEQANE